MSDEKYVNNSTIKLLISDITDIEIDCFVYYATADLKLGSGFGGAITMRGGPEIQKELDKLAPINTTDAVITNAGDLKANYIIHANGPKFQEEETDRKLRETVLNSLRLANEKNIERIAFPPMGAGFYGVPLSVSADICLNTAKDYLENGSKIKEVVFCLLDNREYKPFKERLESL